MARSTCETYQRAVQYGLQQSGAQLAAPARQVAVDSHAVPLGQTVGVTAEHGLRQSVVTVCENMMRTWHESVLF